MQRAAHDRDQFKTSVLAQAATFGLVAADTTPITNDNTDIHAKVTCLRREGRGYGRRASVNSTSATATKAVADKNTSRANANKHARALAGKDGTGANRGNGGRNQNLCSLCYLLNSGPGGVVEMDFDKSISDGVNLYSKRDGDADFIFLACRAGVRRRRARDTARAAPKSAEGGSPYIDNRLPALRRLGGGGREYKCVYVLSDAEIGLLSDEVVVNCAP